MRSCARLLGLGHAVAHKVIFFFFFLLRAPSTKKKKKKAQRKERVRMLKLVTCEQVTEYTQVETRLRCEGLTVCLRSERCTAEKRDGGIQRQ